ncbi:MAG: SPASM domain-containing protein [Chlorobiaceae bacterium]|nr:SPASM domain-containing protein [Chlorobiaceae bacterium]
MSGNDADGKTPDEAGGDGRIACIALFVTQQCNLRCRYCYGGGGEYGNPGVMDESTALTAVDWLLDRCGPLEGRISFFGGEPFLNFPLMKKVAAYAREQAEKRGVRIGFSANTNLTLLDQQKLDFIRDFDVMIIASFDGPKSLFDTLRPALDGKSSYDRAITMLPELIAERGKKVNARATLVPASDPSEVQEAINDMGFKRSHMVRASRSPYAGIADRNGDEAFVEKHLSYTWSAVCRFLAELKERDRSQINRLAKSIGIPLPTRDGFLSGNRMFMGRRKYKCGIGRTYVAVSITGDIYPCHRFAGQEKYRIGSIFDGMPLKMDYCISPVDAVAECSKCWTRFMCGGGCLHEHAGETGDVRIPSLLLCDYEKRRNEMRIALWCSISREDYKWLEECGVVAADLCLLDFG